MSLAASLLPLILLGHGAYPIAYQLVEQPGQPAHLAAGTSFGLLLSDDDGASWKWVCEEAIGYGTGQLPTWYIGPDGTLFGAGFKGLFVSHDQGCTWAADPTFTATGAGDIRSNGTALFVVSQLFGPVNHVWRSTDQGKSWSTLSPASDSQFYTTVRAAPSRPRRIYVAEWWYKPTSTEALEWSDDNGDTFTRIDLTSKMPMGTLGDGGTGIIGGAFYVYAVDPNDPDVLYGGLIQDTEAHTTYVLKSVDRGESWSTILTSPDQLGSMAVAADGGEVFAATALKLYESANGGPFNALTTPTRQSCVDLYDDRLYACGWPEVDGFGVGRATQGSTTFVPVLSWGRIGGVPACGLDSGVCTTCTAFFPALCSTFPSVTLDADSGCAHAEDVSCPGQVQMMMPPPTVTPAQCGCASSGPIFALAALLGLAIRRRAKG